MQQQEILNGAEQARAIATLPSDLAIMRMENDNICALAAARPRDHHKIKADLLAQIDAYPSFAKAVVYSKPVGKDQSGRMQYARGLSVRAAEAVAEAYGYCRVRCDVSQVDADHVKVEATFTDYQRGRIWQDGGIISKFYRSRNGQMIRHADDRFYSLVVKAEASRRIREVILRSVPPGLRSELMELAEKKIDSLLDDGTVKKIIGNFAGKGVTIDMLQEHIGRTVEAGWTKDDRRDLLGLWNAIENEETTIAEAFGQQQTAKKSEPSAAGGASASDLTNPKKVEPGNPKKVEPGKVEPGKAEPGKAEPSEAPLPESSPGADHAEQPRVTKPAAPSPWVEVWAQGNVKEIENKIQTATTGAQYVEMSNELDQYQEAFGPEYDRLKAKLTQKMNEYESRPVAKGKGKR